MNDKWLKAENIAKKIVISAILLGAAILLFLFIPEILTLLLPFVVAYIISFVASPLIRLFEKIKLPGAFSAIISIALVAAGLGGVSFLALNKLISEIYDFSVHIPEIFRSVTDTLSQLRLVAIDVFDLLPDELAPYIQAGVESLQDALSSFSSAVVESISSFTIRFIKNIPGVLIGFVFSILASYFLIRDNKKVRIQLAEFLGENITAKVRELKKYLFSAVFAYIKSQSILMSITFVEVFIGLSILNVRYSFLFAIIIAFVDAIPVFGTGTILLPWALFSLITGRFTLTIGLAIIYGVCLIVRQFLEPKILSSQIGMHPLLTLLSMYVGFRFIGIFGMILGPVVALIIKNFVGNYKRADR